VVVTSVVVFSVGDSAGDSRDIGIVEQRSMGWFWF
jgi:hypothetical protein